MLAKLYQKTDKGREEIATRQYQIDSRLRPLLVTINGTADTNELLARFAGNGMDEECFFYLESEGFIEAIATVDEQVPAITDPTLTEAKAQSEPFTPAAENLDDSGLYEQITEYYNMTIKDQLGLKGVFLQIKVEKAMNLHELAALRNDYYNAIHKSKGEIMAKALVMRLDQLLEGQTA